MVHVENAGPAHVGGGRCTGGWLAGGRAGLFHQPGRAGELLAMDRRTAGPGRVAARQEKAISLPTAWKIGAAMETAYRILHLPGEPRMTRFLAAELGTSHYFDISHALAISAMRRTSRSPNGMRQLATELKNPPPGP